MRRLGDAVSVAVSAAWEYRNRPRWDQEEKKEISPLLARIAHRCRGEGSQLLRLASPVSGKKGKHFDPESHGKYTEDPNVPPDAAGRAVADLQQKACAEPREMRAS
jgi:hypothetical protein